MSGHEPLLSFEQLFQTSPDVRLVCEDMGSRLFFLLLPTGLRLLGHGLLGEV